MVEKKTCTFPQKKRYSHHVKSRLGLPLATSMVFSRLRRPVPGWKFILHSPQLTSIYTSRSVPGSISRLGKSLEPLFKRAKCPPPPLPASGGGGGMAIPHVER